MRPLIGIVARIEYPGDQDKLAINDEYRRAVIEFGGNPFLILPPQVLDYGKTKVKDIPFLTEEEKAMLIQQLKMCDGILMPGGFKMVSYDFFILDYAIQNNVPILGVCLGMQVMANYRREVWNEPNDPNGINHDLESDELAHFVKVDQNSKLYSIIGEDYFKVNSFHKMHVLPNSYYQVSAYSEDGLIEALEMPNKSFHIGVQWHPERMITSSVSKRLFSSFVEAACSYQNDEKIVTIYSHN